MLRSKVVHLRPLRFIDGHVTQNYDQKHRLGPETDLRGFACSLYASLAEIL